MKKKLVFTAAAIAGIILIVLVGIRLVPQPKNLGTTAGQLAPCPDSPNCVNTQSTSADHQIAPLKMAGTIDEARAQLRQVITGRPRTRIIEEGEYYWHVEFRSALFGFCDDVEFLIDPEQQVIHFRSASRIGRSDLGANRQRMESIRDDFEAASN